MIGQIWKYRTSILQTTPNLLLISNRVLSFGFISVQVKNITTEAERGIGFAWKKESFKLKGPLNWYNRPNLTNTCQDYYYYRLAYIAKNCRSLLASLVSSNLSAAKTWRNKFFVAFMYLCCVH